MRHLYAFHRRVHTPLNKCCMPDHVFIYSMNATRGSKDSVDVLHTAESATYVCQSAMLRIRASSGRVICTIDPADHTDCKTRVLDDLAVTVGSHLGVPAPRISIHPIDGHGQTPLNPTTTWANCQRLVATESQELMAVVRHYQDGRIHELSAAIEMERYYEVRSLLENLADPNSVIYHEAVFSGRCSPLSLAAYTNFGCSCIGEALVEAQADVDGKHFGTSPLVAACETRNAQMASFLIQAGADVNRPTWWTDTPLLIAASIDSTPLVRLLLQNHANVNQQGPQQRGPIEEAFQSDAVRVATCLVRAKAQVQPHTYDKCLLHRAASRGSITWVKLLIRAGADPQGKDQHGRLPLDVRRRLPSFLQRQQLKRSLCPASPAFAQHEPSPRGHKDHAHEKTFH